MRPYGPSESGGTPYWQEYTEEADHLRHHEVQSHKKSKRFRNETIPKPFCLQFEAEILISAFFHLCT